MERRKVIQLATLGMAGTVTSANAAESTPKTKHTSDMSHLSPGAVPPEFILNEKGERVPNPDLRFAFSKCYGCFNVCGARVWIDNKTDTVVRVAGNPYALTNGAGIPVSTDMAPQAVINALYERGGMDKRATLCGRGNAVIDAFKDKHRVTTCLKRVGKRGENRWKSIPYETLLAEVIEGGDLFGEGHVDGLRAIYNKKDPANPLYPDFGPGRNQLFVGTSSEQGIRTDLMSRFIKDAWGTPNVGCKDSYCGHQQVAGCAMGCFDAVDEGALPATDYDHCEFAIFIGTTPGLSGVGLNSGSRRLANARTRQNFKYVVVDPILRSVTPQASSDVAEWIPIKAGGDTALLFGMLQTIINEKRYNEAYLSSPNQAVAQKKGEVNYTNATHLVVKDPTHPLNTQFLTAEAAGLGAAEEKVVISKAHHALANAAKANGDAELFFDGDVVLSNGKTVHVVTAMELLRRRVNEKPLSAYAKRSGIAPEKIESLAKEFTSHGRKVSIETNTACNATDGGIFGYTMILLGTMVGAHNAKGGMFHMGGCGLDAIYEIWDGPLFKLNEFEKTEPVGFPAERSGNYEESDEYKKKVAAGQNPYQSNEPWNSTIVQENSGEMLVAHANANPFQFKAWINWSTNPFYNCAGLESQVKASVVDPKQLGLIIGIDPYINETNVYADYIVPDLLQYEQWMLCRMWGSELVGSVACVPVVEPRTVKNKKGQHVSMEQFIIDVSKALGLAGFGEKAFKDAKGQWRRLDVPEDLYVPLFANAALSGDKLPAPTKADVRFTSVDRVAPLFKSRLTPESFASTMYMLTRGGRFETMETRYDGDFFVEDLRMDTEFQLYNQTLARTKDSYTGECWDGQPICDVDRFWDGSAVRDHYSEKDYPFVFTTFKSHLRSSYSAVLPRVTAIEKHNFVQMNVRDAQALGLKTGDKVRVVTPRNTFIEGPLQADDTVAQGTVVVPTGYGHTQFGAATMEVDGQVIKGDKARAGGMAVNPFNIVDPTRKGASLYRDRVFGSTARHGVPVKVEKVA